MSEGYAMRENIMKMKNEREKKTKVDARPRTTAYPHRQVSIRSSVFFEGGSSMS